MASLQYSLQFVFSIVLGTVLLMVLHHTIQDSEIFQVVESIFSTGTLENLPSVEQGHDGSTLRLQREGQQVEIPLLDEAMVDEISRAVQ